MTPISSFRPTESRDRGAIVPAMSAIRDLETTVPAAVTRSVPAGFMTPLHRRDEHEIYTVLDGTVTFFIDDEIVTAKGGDVVEAPAGSERTVRADTRARWIVSTTVTSVERFADFGRAIAPPLREAGRGWPSQEELASLTAIASANGIELLGPPGATP